MARTCLLTSADMSYKCLNGSAYIFSFKTGIMYIKPASKKYKKNKQVRSILAIDFSCNKLFKSALFVYVPILERRGKLMATQECKSNIVLNS